MTSSVMGYRANWAFSWLLLFAAGLMASSAATSETPISDNHGLPRVIVLTDIGNEPDDAQSLIRFLLYSTDYDIEGIFATTSQFLKDTVMTEKLFERIDAYERVYDNLTVHHKGYPKPALLRQRTAACQSGFGMDAVGKNWGSEGARRIIRAVNQDDPRPLWVLIWGGGNCLAQALWQVSQERSPQEVDTFIAKLKVYGISDQDDAGPWLRQQYPNLEIIVSPGSNSRYYKHATWRGIAGDHSWNASFTAELFCYLKQWLGFSCGEPPGGPDFAMVDNPWLDQNIRLGPLGALYPRTHFIMEGDSPSFMNLIDNGLSADLSPAWGGWGGRYALSTPLGETRPIWTNSDDRVIDRIGQTHTSNQATIWRWRKAYQWDFAGRMAWTLTDVYSAVNHPPQVVVDNDATASPVYRIVHPGEVVEFTLDTRDPDGDQLQLRIWHYQEAGTSQSQPHISVQGQSLVRVLMPDSATLGTSHLIIEATDSGTPALTRYRRVILATTQVADGG